MPIFDTYYSVILPDIKGNFQDEWSNCLAKLISEIRGTHRQIFKMNIFIHADTEQELHQKKQYIFNALFDAFGDTCPTFGVSAHSPEQSFQVTIEAVFTDSPEIKIYYRKSDAWRYVILESTDYKELWVSGIEGIIAGDMEISARGPFEALYKILDKERLSFNHIVRQWNYIGKIFQDVNPNQDHVQYYHIFNSVRCDYYRQYRKIPRFPAATGIGMKFNGLMIDCCALATENNIRIIPIANPHQINPYSYRNEIYFNSLHNREGQMQLPLFERAILITQNDRSRLFISGTASVIGQDTVGKGDVGQQTRITIENIETLSSKENLDNNYPQLKVFPDKYRYIRVYVKYATDIPIVKSICSSQFVNVAASYIVADICREDLLVEIEAEKYS